MPPMRMLGKLRLIQTTPAYGVDIDAVLGLAERGCFIHVHAAGWDLVHSPHAAFWSAAERAHSGRIRYTYHPYWSHWGMCLRFFGLGLHLDEALWHEPREQAANMPPRSKL